MLIRPDPLEGVYIIIGEIRERLRLCQSVGPRSNCRSTLLLWLDGVLPVSLYNLIAGWLRLHRGGTATKQKVIRPTRCPLRGISSACFAMNSSSFEYLPTSETTGSMYHNITLGPVRLRHIIPRICILRLGILRLHSFTSHCQAVLR
jgi:hypothetical protein